MNYSEVLHKTYLPLKSIIGSGIIAIYPSKYTIAVYSPKLNKKGNSIKRFAFLEQFTINLESSIF